jgi:hypothetical protein
MQHEPPIPEIESRLFVRWLKSPSLLKRSVAVAMHLWIAFLALAMFTSPVWIGIAVWLYLA